MGGGAKSQSTTAGLPGWPLLGLISEIWPRFKLFGLKNSSGLLAVFWPFNDDKVSSAGKYHYSTFSATDRRPRSDVSTVELV